MSFIKRNTLLFVKLNKEKWEENVGKKHTTAECDFRWKYPTTQIRKMDAKRFFLDSF